MKLTLSFSVITGLIIGYLLSPLIPKIEYYSNFQTVQGHCLQNSVGHGASILRPALRDYGGHVAHRATTESRVQFHGSSLPTGTLVQEGVTPRPWVNEEIKEEC
jgi:hypothetical protein